MAKLYIVATPIGHLEDISERTLQTLRRVDLILAEDTRVTKKLLTRYGIRTPLLSYHQHSKLKKVNYILNLLKQGKNLALVSDAGTPGISDPGGKLVEKVAEFFGDKVDIIPIPGPSALITAASISGIAMDSFLFLGYPPAKKKRKKFFQKIINSEDPVIFYESPHRILKTLKELKFILAQYHLQDAKVVVCKELTKKFEKIYRGNIEKIIEQIKKAPTKGEYTVVVSFRVSARS